jgi:hypothetical protein
VLLQEQLFNNTLWIDYVNHLITQNPKLERDLIKKPNWLLMIKSIEEII